MRRLYRFRRRIQFRLHPSREECRRPLRSPRTKSSDDLAFIGTISLETRKQLVARTNLSLWTDYEYISSVPELQYAKYGGTTHIGEDDAFATRTMLRLNIGLGSQQLYPEPMK